MHKYIIIFTYSNKVQLLKYCPPLAVIYMQFMRWTKITALQITINL